MSAPRRESAATSWRDHLPEIESLSEAIAQDLGQVFEERERRTRALEQRLQAVAVVLSRVLVLDGDSLAHFFEKFDPHCCHVDRELFEVFHGSSYGDSSAAPSDSGSEAGAS